MNPWEMNWSGGATAPANTAAAVPSQSGASATPSPPVNASVAPQGASASSKPWEMNWSAANTNAEPDTTAGGLAASAGRGLAPYAAGAGAGALIGSVIPGAGTLAGAAAGAGAVGLSDLVAGASRIANRFMGSPVMSSARDLTDKLLDLAGIQRPQTAAERIADATAGGIGGAVSGAGLAGKVADVATNPVAKGVAETIANADSPTANAVLGGVSGLGAQTGYEVAPEEYKPLAATVGGIAAPLVAGGAAVGAQAVGRGVANTVGDYVAPMGIGKQINLGADADGNPITATAPQAKIAAAQLRNAASHSSALADAIDDALQQGPLVEGAQPTTGQLTNDPGLLALERTQATANPAPFNQRRIDQQGAQADALNAVQPVGNPGSVGQFVRGLLADQDARQEANVTAAQGTADRAAAALGGTDTNQNYGAGLRDILSESKAGVKTAADALYKAIDPDGTLVLDTSPLTDAAKSIAGEMNKYDEPMGDREASIFSAAAQMPQTVPYSDIQAIFTRLKTAIRTGRASAGTDPQSLRRMGMLADAMADTIATGADRVATEQAPAVAAGTLAPDQSLAGRLASWRDQWYDQKNAPAIAATTNEGTSGESPVTGFVGNAGGGSGSIPGVGGTEGTTGGGFGGVTGSPGIQNKFSTPVKSPTDEMLARIQANPGYDWGLRITENPHKIGETLPPSRVWNDGVPTNDLLSGTSVVQIKQPTQEGISQALSDAGVGAPGRNGSYFGKNVALVRGDYVGPGEDHGEALFKNASPVAIFQKSGEGAESLIAPSATNPLTPNFDEGAAGRIGAANTFYRDYKQTFGTGATGQVLRPGPNGTPFTVPDSAVAAKFFNAGAHPAEDVQSFITAAGGRSDASAMLQDYAASDLLKSVRRPDGTLDPTKIARWASQHQDALAPFPDLAAKVQNVQGATQMVNDAMAARSAATKAAQKFAAQEFIGTDPVQAAATMIKTPADAAKMARWAALDTSGDATTGLQRAVIENIQKRFLTESSGTPAIRPQQFQDYIRQNRQSLTNVLGADRMALLDRLSSSLQQTNPMRGKMPGGPGTAQDLTGVANSPTGSAHGGVMSMLGNHLPMLGALLTESATHNLAATAGAVGAGIGAKMLNSFRTAGLGKVDDIVTESLLHPEIGRTLLTNYSPKEQALILPGLLSRIAGLGLTNGAQQPVQQ